LTYQAENNNETQDEHRDCQHLDGHPRHGARMLTKINGNNMIAMILIALANFIGASKDSQSWLIILAFTIIILFIEPGELLARQQSNTCAVVIPYLKLVKVAIKSCNISQDHSNESKDGSHREQSMLVWAATPARRKEKERK
jgi:hypothetical protein